MCQAYEAERAVIVDSELRAIRKKWEAHQRGEIQLSDDELFKMAIEKMMLEER